MRQSSIVIFLIISFPILLYSGTNGTLEGMIHDKVTKMPLVFVTVQIIGTPIGNSSDNDGYYQINNIRAGVYDIRFSIIGYQPVIVKKITIVADLRTRLDLDMDPSVVELDAIEIISQKQLIQKDLPWTTFSVGSVKLEKLPLTSIKDLLPLQPGTTLEGNVRGGKINEVLYLIDGVPMQDVIGGEFSAELPRSSVIGMTMYSGGFEAEYGNAMSGVVNVITKTGDNTQKNDIRFEKDNYIPSRWNKQVDQYNELEVTTSGPIVNDKLFYLSAATIRLSNSRWWQDMQYFFHSPFNQEYNGLSKLSYNLTNSIKLGLQAIYSFNQWNDYEFSWRYNLNGLPERSKFTFRGILNFTHIVSENSTYTLNFSRFYLRDRIGGGKKEDIELTPYQYDFFLRYIIDGKKNWWASTQQLVYSMKGDYSLQIDNNQFFKAGTEINFYDIFNDIVKYEPQRTYFGKPLENAPLLNYSNQYEYFPRTGSVYIQDKIRFSLDGSSMSVGVRWDFLDPRAQRPIVEFIPKTATEFEQKLTGYSTAHFKQQISPRFAFSVPITTNSIMFVNIGQYFQFPLFDYLYSGISPAQLQSGTRNVLTGNPDLEPERTLAWEVGFKHAPSDNIVWSITYFKKDIKNQIDTKTLIPFDSKSAGDFGFSQYVNNAFADASGVECVLNYDQKELFSGNFSYTYMDTRGTSEMANQSINLAQWGFPIQTVSFPLGWDQRHTLKLDVETTLWEKIFANMIVWYNSPKPYTFFPTRDGFTPVDSTKDFVPNNARMKDVFFINLKLTREFTFVDNIFKKMMVYVDIRNLLNKKNIKWIDSNGRVGGELSDPSSYYDLRRVRVGITVNM